jgi:hypothetical protein
LFRLTTERKWNVLGKGVKKKNGWQQRERERLAFICKGRGEGLREGKNNESSKYTPSGQMGDI